MSAGSSLRKGLASQRDTAFEAIKRTNEQIRAIVEQVNAAFEDVNTKLDDLGRLSAAFTKLIGEEEVTAEIQRQRIEELNADSARIGEIIQKSVDAGTLVASDVIADDKTVVVSTERDPQGKVRQPEFIRTALAVYNDDVKKLLLGKKVGDVLTMEDGSTITIIEVYQPVAKGEEPKGVGASAPGEGVDLAEAEASDTRAQA